VLVTILAHEEDAVWVLKQRDALAVAVYLAPPCPRRRQRLNITLQTTLINALKSVLKVRIKALLCIVFDCIGYRGGLASLIRRDDRAFRHRFAQLRLESIAR
jgi:hypothetical protein